MITDLAHDMILNLDEINFKQRAAGFMQRFQKALCVFSGSVNQLYSNYQIEVLNKDFSRLAVQPDYYAYHDIFQAIDESAVLPTGLYIMPGESVGKDGLLLAQQNTQGKLVVSELADGIRKIQANFTKEAPFLPVIRNTDLREFRRQAPMIHLHRIHTEELRQELSGFQVRDIQRTIIEKIDDYLFTA